jgi:single-strand DNA-binding protein
VANDINKVVVVGRLVRDPELRQVGSGTSLCKISIANGRNYTVNGERKEETSYFNCTAWGKQAEIINQYCRKGKQVAIEGRLQQNRWQGTDGKTMSAVDIVIEKLQMLGSASEGSGGSRSGGSSGGGQPDPAYPGDEVAGGYTPMDDGFSSDMGDDDMPF